MLLTIDRQLVAKGKCLLTEESRTASDRSLAGSIFFSKKANFGQAWRQVSTKYHFHQRVGCIFQVQHINQNFH